MRKLLLFLCLTSFCYSSFGKEEKQKRIYNNITISSGLFYSPYQPGSSAFTLGLSYGAEFYLQDKWSLMPGIRGYVGLWPGTDSFEGVPFVDIFCIPRYRLDIKSVDNLMIGIGPYVSFMGYNDVQDDAGFMYPKAFAPLQAGIVCSVAAILSDVWIIGLEAQTGLSQLMVPDRIFFKEIRLNVGIRF